MASSRSLYVVVVLLVAGLLASSTVAAFYLFQYNQAESNANAYLGELRQATGSAPLTSDILLNFGNGTRAWYNSTVVQPGWNLYLATVVITRGDMNATWYGAPYDEHIVNGIDGIQNSQSDSWFIWSYNSTSHWQAAQVGADLLPVPGGSLFAWTYCGITSTYGPTCASPEA